MSLTRSTLFNLTLVSFLTALMLPIADANVSLKNGNFFIGYTDIVYPGGFEPKIARVYNSKSNYEGMFGAGWGNEYEVYLTVSADGAVVIHEYGGGAENRFVPKSFNKQELDAAVEMIAAAARKHGAISATYKDDLRKNATFRNDEWEKFRSRGELKARQIAPNTQLHSNHFSYQYITKVADGYVRSFDNGRVERFADNGKLIRVSDKNGNFMSFSYSKDEKLEKIVDNFNRKMFFTYNTLGKVEKIQGENGKTANYKYNELGELVYSKDVDNNTYVYKYGADKRHNLVQIQYTDKTTMDVTYYGRDKHENVKAVKDRDGSVTEYAYEDDVKARGHLAVGVKIRGSDGKVISTSRYEYVLKTKADGEEWTYKMVTDLDGERTETVYNQDGGLPLSIKRGKEETTFAYDSKGHVIKKTSPTEVTQLQYHPSFGKVTRVDRLDRRNSKSINWSTFQYDEKGNLVYAKNSEGKGVKLFYDTTGRISTLVDQNKRQIRFKYNEESKPVEITDPAVGTITVTYANSGEIKKVDSTAGRKIALQVTSAFQNLLDIIRPAGVSLSF